MAEVVKAQALLVEIGPKSVRLPVAVPTKNGHWAEGDPLIQQDMSGRTANVKK